MYAVIICVSQYGRFRRLTLFPSSGIGKQTRHAIPLSRNFQSPWNRFLLENVIVANLIQKLYSRLDGNRGFNVVKISTLT
jgi:hypothetical protein